MNRLPGLAAAVILASTLAGEDWPEWRGANRLGVWKETGILEEFPKEGLTFKWRTPIHGGFAGPSVAAGRVFVSDFVRGANTKGTERVLCLDEKTGKILWTQQWDADYIGLMQTYAIGPRATPTVDGDYLYVLGAKGALVCLKVKTGEVVWKKDFVKDYDTQVPTWGMASAPLIDGPRVIAVVGGAGNGKVMAFDKRSGKEIWRALSSEKEEPGYCQPILFEAAGIRQVIIWHPFAIVSLDPVSGKVNWQQPFRANASLTLATPAMHDTRMLISSFYNGSVMLDMSKREATKIWQGKSDSEIRPDGLHSLISTPVFDGDYIYGVCGYGQFRCLRAATGEQVWETQAVTGEKARWATALIVRNGDRFFINNDQGELIIARLKPEGYQEISRTRLIKPTSNPGNRRKAPAVNWSQPAYANKHIFARNDEEILSASLAK
ncbi:MAG TPA: PQQ-binding-like beta-propeller repeat protein [Bryobacteraceae bacterium]|nr:PQQ-binding-like beta-propeller repeat protein [Bryobacteraceae bacterium]